MQHNSLAFVAALKRATDEGSLPEIAQYSPYYLPLNVFTASKGSNLYILFNPIIMSTPNDYNTVYTILKRTKEHINALGQSVCPIVFDMGLLAKALEVVWARPEELSGVIPLEGGMHFMMSLFGGIGYI